MAQLWHVVAMLHRSERCGTDMGITSFVNTKQIQHTSGGKTQCIRMGKKACTSDCSPSCLRCCPFQKPRLVQNFILPLEGAIYALPKGIHSFC